MITGQQTNNDTVLCKKCGTKVSRHDAISGTFEDFEDNTSGIINILYCPNCNTSLTWKITYYIKTIED